MAYCISRAVSRGQGEALSNKYQVKRFLRAEKMHKFMNTGGNALFWREINADLKSGYYFTRMDRSGVQWINVKNLTL